MSVGKKRLFSLALVAAGGALGARALAKPEGFYLDQLPHGAEVTLPQPNTVFLPASGSVELTATDTPQTLKLATVNVGSGIAREVDLAIFDRYEDRVKHVHLMPGLRFLYTFKSLGSITVVASPAPAARAVARDLRVSVDSDKPLGIKH